MSNPRQSHSPASGTIAGKDAFINRLANRLGRSVPLAQAPARPVIGVPEHYAARQTTVQERIDQFSANWSALTGTVWTARLDAAAEAVPAYARTVCAEREIDLVTRWAHPDLDRLPLDDGLAADGVSVVPWREGGAASWTPPSGAAAPEGSVWSTRSPLLRAAERSRLGIVWADYAIANTGTLVLLAHGGNGRSVSLLPDTLFAVIRASRLVTRMGEAFEAIRADYPEATAMPSSVNLITGPSRSADIENDLTIGIHGPGKVYALILED
ncbi:lactate utilization protein [Paenibacillus hodogayensis]|uniref:Lactate utilization protein n=1 Tax=Paenibacillus hodogayensis TaxID=279208 RepID=A0ABV5W592_9BACL